MFLALEEQESEKVRLVFKCLLLATAVFTLDSQKRPSPVNEEVVSFSNTREGDYEKFCDSCLVSWWVSVGRIVVGLVREFLEFYELSATLAVFEPEADVVSLN